MKDENQKATLLIIDDSPENLKVLSDLLKKSGFKVLIASDGEEGIAHALFAKPDIILLDILMPGIDGFETCEKLKKIKETKDIPVIFMTALSDTAEKLKGFRMGAADYITKPFQYEEVLARITKELTILRQKEALQELNEAKDRFFSIIAHDLRNPFSNLIGVTEHLADSVDNMKKEQIKELLKSLNESSKRAFRLLENLLDWARSQTGALSWKPSEIDLNRIIEYDLKLLKDTARKKGIALVNEVAENSYVYADMDMLRTVVRNLITNAIKFTPSGGQVKITSEATGDFISVSVSDTGIGIKEEDIAQLFRIDSQLKTSGTAGEKGSGLGLLLCKEFVEKNGGHIHVESRIGKGTTFRLTLPRGSV